MPGEALVRSAQGREEASEEQVVTSASRGGPVALALGCAASQHGCLLGLTEGTVVRTPCASPWTPPWPGGLPSAAPCQACWRGPPRHLGGPAGVCWVDRLQEEHVKGKKVLRSAVGKWGGGLEEEPWGREGRRPRVGSRCGRGRVAECWV